MMVVEFNEDMTFSEVGP